MEKKYLLNPNLEVIKNGWKGNLFVNGKFIECASKSDGLLTTIKWVIKMKFLGKRTKSIAEVSNDLGKIPIGDYVLWLGHSCFLVRIGGKVILTDPCFYDIPFSPRLINFSVDFSRFEKIDYVLISHNHPDHLNIRSLKEVVKLNPHVKILAPMNAQSFLSRISENVEEASWFQKYKTDKIEVYFMPAYHWTRSNFLNKNKILRGSFVIRFNDKTLFFTGDTTSKSNFNEIRKFFPKIDCSFISIAPSVYPEFHIPGDEAIKIAKLLGSKKIIPMHYGTYQQSLEDDNYSMNLFINEAKKQKIFDKCLILPVGKYFEL